VMPYAAVTAGGNPRCRMLGVVIPLGWSLGAAGLAVTVWADDAAAVGAGTSNGNGVLVLSLGFDRPSDVDWGRHCVGILCRRSRRGRQRAAARLTKRLFSRDFGPTVWTGQAPVLLPNGYWRRGVRFWAGCGSSGLRQVVSHRRVIVGSSVARRWLCRPAHSDAARWSRFLPAGDKWSPIRRAGSPPAPHRRRL
jgi:hypothetical protein